MDGATVPQQSVAFGLAAAANDMWAVVAVKFETYGKKREWLW